MDEEIGTAIRLKTRLIAGPKIHPSQKGHFRRNILGHPQACWAVDIFKVIRKMATGSDGSSVMQPMNTLFAGKAERQTQGQKCVVRDKSYYQS